MRQFLPVLLLTTIGCGVSEEDFQEEFAMGACSLMFECGATDDTGLGGGMLFFSTEGECVEFYDLVFALGTSGCDYDKKAAKECLAALDETTCDSSDDAGGEACGDVYTGDDCEWSGSSSDSGR